MYNCHDCKYLDKTRTRIKDDLIKYGCNLYEDAYVMGWSKGAPINQGCSDWIEIGGVHDKSRTRTTKTLNDRD